MRTEPKGKLDKNAYYILLCLIEGIYKAIAILNLRVCFLNLAFTVYSTPVPDSTKIAFSYIHCCSSFENTNTHLFQWKTFFSLQIEKRFSHMLLQLRNATVLFYFIYHPSAAAVIFQRRL